MSTEEKVTRKLRAILSADVKGYSLLMANDEAYTIKKLEAYRDSMSDLIRSHSGRVVDAVGDNLLAEFSSVVDAVRCAVEIQKDLQQKNADLPSDKRLEFRIGVNIGDVVQEGDRIYGNGVNVAARIEALAEPGGICISRNAYSHVRDKLELGYEYLGEHNVKNIKRPIRVYKVLMDPEDAGELIGDIPKPAAKKWIWATVILAVIVITTVVWVGYQKITEPDFEPAKLEEMAYPLPDKPSIVVLPFVNMSEDPKQDYFSDGITEQITTTLSKMPSMFVISRTSSFAYKGKRVRVQQVSEDLGVRYVLEGSVQRSNDKVRITVQLIDAIDGKHIWAQRYDRELKDIFKLQDEISLKIIRGLRIKLTEGEQAHLWSRNYPSSVEYEEKRLKARFFLSQGNKESNYKARQLYKEAITIEPEYWAAYAGLAMTHQTDVWLGLSTSPGESMDKAFKLCQKAILYDEKQDVPHLVIGNIYLLKRKYNLAMKEVKRAITLNPNSALGYTYLGQILLYSGRPEEAIVSINKSMRLSPLPSSYSIAILAIAYREAGRYEEAITEYRRALTLRPGNILAYVGLSMTYALSGQVVKAREAYSEALKIDPEYSFEKTLQTYPLSSERKEIIRVAMRKAGLPEHPLSIAPPEKPSIAVLAFDNLSGDPEQEYFADGISESIITALSKVGKLFVIARNSSFTFKGKPVRVQQIGRELGVRYVLEGSVQKSGDRVRITAQLIDSKNGEHLWAENYDRDMKDIFELQDDLTMEIINALQVKLTEGDHARLWMKGTHNLEAYLKSLKARELYLTQTRENNAQAQRIAEEAIALDPEYPPPYHVLSATHFFDIVFGTTKSPNESIKKAVGLIQKAITLDDTYALAHGWLGSLYTMLLRQYDKGIMEAQKGVALDPNGAHNYLYLQMTLSYAGRHDEAVHAIEKAMRLNPIPPVTYYSQACMTYVFTKQYEKAIEAGEQALKVSSPDDTISRMILTIAYISAGQEQKARSMAEDILRLRPNFSVQKSLKKAPYKNTVDADIFAGSLRKAGLPD